MTAYKVVGQGSSRPFEITGGLQEGYGPSGKLHDLSEVVAVHHAWQTKTGTIMGMTVQPNTVSYGWPQDGTIHSASEPGWKISGGVNVVYDKDLTADEVWSRLESLAAFVAAALGQTRVYLTFVGEDRILQADDHSKPRPETDSVKEEKLILLDVDGVINTPEDVIAGTDGYRKLNPTLAGRFAALIRETGASIVVTSGWRQMVHDKIVTIDGLAAVLRSHGIVTPDGDTGLTNLVAGVLAGGWKDGKKAQRAELVADYLATAGPVKYVILDDQDLGFTAQGLTLVQTDDASD